MHMKDQYLERMKEYLQDEYEDYVKTIEKPIKKGLCVNTCKSNFSFIQEQLNLPFEKSPFCENGYIFDSNERLGNHWTHLAGLYYLQEPSASCVVEALDIQANDWVLDCCAAPGGKSHQIASKLNHTGFLLSNELEPKRAAILLSNMERCGFSENMITCSPIEKLAPQIKGLFDKVLVDAPCSGEGMMKKHEIASLEWSRENNLSCKMRQLHILEDAFKCLKEGGILVYSTCTYAMEENEQVVYEFLKQHAEAELLDGGDHVKRCGMAYKDLDVSKVRRIYPMDGGEGHFFAKIRKNGTSETSKMKFVKEKKIDDAVGQFMKEQIDIPMHFIEINQKIYARRQPFLDLKATILRQGICCGEMMKKRFEPHHHFYTASYLQNHYLKKVELNEIQLKQYLSGNILEIPVKGYVCLTYCSHPIGFGKGDGRIIKNKYPKGLRIT